MITDRGQTPIPLVAPPVRIDNPAAPARFLLIGDHAGNAVPPALEPFGVAATDLHRHIGWDIGIAGLGTRLATLLDATFLHQAYSRLVIDCNRDPAAIDAMPATSDGTPIPANAGLSSADRTTRVAAIHTPYHAAIAADLARRDAAGQDTVLVALHSFTPSMRGIARPWHVGVLYSGGDTRFARGVLDALRQDGDLVVGDNEPYAMDAIDYTIPRHAFVAGRPYVELEIRQDLLATPAGQADWARRLAGLLASVTDRPAASGSAAP